MQKLIPLSDITLSNSFRVRSAIDSSVVDEYAEAMENHAVFPAIELFQTNKRTLLLVDGWHRFYAARKVNVKKMLANIIEGDEAEALRFALRCNACHGLRRSNADKRRCVTLALEKWPDSSGRALAQLCGVSYVFVNKLRAVLDSIPEPIKEEPPAPPEPAPKPASKKQAAPEVLLDSVGYPIPEKAAIIWNRRNEPEHILHFVHAVQDELKAVAEAKDTLWTEVSFASVLSHLDQIKDHIECAMPYAVCTTCQGQLPETCTFCGGRGMISKFRWNSVVPEEIKKLRKGEK